MPLITITCSPYGTSLITKLPSPSAFVNTFSAGIDTFRPVNAALVVLLMSFPLTIAVFLAFCAKEIVVIESNSVKIEKKLRPIPG